MKYLVFLATIIAIIYECQAYNVVIEFKAKNFNNHFTKAEITGQAIGATDVYNFSLRNRYFFTDETFQHEFNFPEYIKSIKITWNSNSSEKVMLKPIIVSYNELTENIANMVYLPEKNQVVNKETIAFKEA